MDVKEKLKTLRSHLCIHALVSMYGGGTVLVHIGERNREIRYVSVYTTVTSKSLLVANSKYCENSFFHDN